jgi:hypothetical protein
MKGFWNNARAEPGEMICNSREDGAGISFSKMQNGGAVNQDSTEMCI